MTASRLRVASISARGNVLLTGVDGRLRLVRDASATRAEGRRGTRSRNLGGREVRGRPVRRVRAGRPRPEVRVVDLRPGDRGLEVDHGAPATTASLSAGGYVARHGGRRSAGAGLAGPGRQAPAGLPRPCRTNHRDRVQQARHAARDSEHRRHRTHLGCRGRPAGLRPLGTHELPEGHCVQPGRYPGGHRQPRQNGRTWKAETGAALATCAGATDAIVSAAFTLRGTRSSRQASMERPHLGRRRAAGACGRRGLHAPVGALDFIARAGPRLSGRKCSYHVALPNGPASPSGQRPRDLGVVGPRRSPRSQDGKTVTVTRPDGTALKSSDTAARHVGRILVRRGSGRDRERRPRCPNLGRSHRRALQVLAGHFAIVSERASAPTDAGSSPPGPGRAGSGAPPRGSPSTSSAATRESALAAFAPDGSGWPRGVPTGRSGSGGARSAAGSTSSSPSQTRASRHRPRPDGRGAPAVRPLRRRPPNRCSGRGVQR